MNERYYSLQIMRGIAAWMVFYHHYMQIFYNLKYESNLGGFFAEYGSFGVDIFFVLSGFVMYFSATKANVSATTFFIRRIFRILPAYWFYTILIMVFLKLFPVEFAYTDYDVKSLVLSLGFIPHENPSGIGDYPLHTVGWTLNFEMMFYAVLSLSILLSKRYAIIICGLFILAAPIFWPKNIIFSQLLGSFLLYEFFSGVVIAAVVSSKWFKRFYNYHILMLLSSAVFGLLCLKYSYAHLLLKLMASASIVFSVSLANQYIKKENLFFRFLIKVGDCSYSTYLIHIFILAVALHFFGNDLMLHEEAFLVAALSVFLYVLSQISYYFIERNRYLLGVENSALGLFERRKG